MTPALEGAHDTPARCHLVSIIGTPLRGGHSAFGFCVSSRYHFRDLFPLCSSFWYLKRCGVTARADLLDAALRGGA